MRRILVVAVLAACGSTTPQPSASPASSPSPSPSPSPITKQSGDPESRFGPLEVGADYLTYRKLTPEPFLSKVHGNRWVDVYVNELGADAYLDDKDIPVGTIVVKTSWEKGADGKVSDVPGPIFVMRKEAPGYWPEHEDWYYAIHWEKPTAEMAKRTGGPFYWRGRSPKVEYCYDCHDSYDRSLGGLTPSSVLMR